MTEHIISDEKKNLGIIDNFIKENQIIDFVDLIFKHSKKSNIKIIGFFSVILTNLKGPNANYFLVNSDFINLYILENHTVIDNEDVPFD